MIIITIITGIITGGKKTKHDNNKKLISSSLKHLKNNEPREKGLPG